MLGNKARHGSDCRSKPSMDSAVAEMFDCTSGSPCSQKQKDGIECDVFFITACFTALLIKHSVSLVIEQ